MKARLILFAFCLSFASSLARADYGWIPEYKKLVTRFGLDVFKSESNYDTTGAIVALPSNGQLSDTILSLSAEYGLAESWSLGMDLPFYISSLDSPTSRLLAGTGLGDITTHLKWAVKPVTPIVTLELLLKFPSGSSGVGTGNLALGEGNFDMGLFLHSGHRSGHFMFSFSPGFLARFGGYSMAAAGEFAFQFMFPRGYLRAFGLGIYSFQDVPGFDSSISSHDASGSGGSYARLNASPVGFAIGGKIGLNITKAVALEFSGTKAILGSKYANYFKAGGDIVVEFDFFEMPKSMKAKEVPFDFEYEKY